MSSGGSPPAMQGPIPPDEDRGPRLEAAYWTWSAVSILMLCLRIYARVKIRGLGWDDWMMVITVILFVITACFVTYMASIGGARHVFYLSPEQTMEAVKWSWISQPWAIFLFATGKASVAILILRFMSRNTVWRRALLYFIIVTIFIINSLGCIFTFVQCDPPRALWNPTIKANCWDPSVQQNYNYFLAAWNIAADLVLAILPATIISGLNLQRGKKIALCVLLGLGVIAALFSGIKVRYIVNLTSRSDFTWSAYDIQMWTGAEAFVMIFCGNIPPLQPLWDRYVTHKLDSSYGRTPLKGSGGYNSGGSPPSSRFRRSGWRATSSAKQSLKTDSSETDHPLPVQSPPMGQIAATTNIEVRLGSKDVTHGSGGNWA
ncbi:integral membrane protein [Diaporthe sp. PMI_573]|nr:integral membrane protein [Diaporthaceae sp. PMI_573]